MTIRHLCVSLLMGIGILLLADGAVQAQLGSGSGSGAAVGPGDPEITSPENGGDRGTSGGGGTIEPGQDSGKVRPEGAIIMKPKPGEAGARDLADPRIEAPLILAKDHPAETRRA